MVATTTIVLIVAAIGGAAFLVSQSSSTHSRQSSQTGGTVSNSTATTPSTTTPATSSVTPANTTPVHATLHKLVGSDEPIDPNKKKYTSNSTHSGKGKHSGKGPTPDNTGELELKMKYASQNSTEVHNGTQTHVDADMQSVHESVAQEEAAVAAVHESVHTGETVPTIHWTTTRDADMKALSLEQLTEITRNEITNKLGGHGTTWMQGGYTYWATDSLRTEWSRRDMRDVYDTFW